ncbi:hypothetical protein [Caudoviricetes sp.]|nr:hypothetical protein [Caudoviricetes sp.]
MRTSRRRWIASTPSSTGSRTHSSRITSSWPCRIPPRRPASGTR